MIDLKIALEIRSAGVKRSRPLGRN